MKNNSFNLVSTYGENNRIRTYKATTPTGEKITVEIIDSESDFKYRRSLAWFWRHEGWIKTKRGEKIYKYKTVHTYCEREREFGCWGLHNPTHTKEGKLNFKYDHASDEAILNAIWKRANKNCEVLTAQNINSFDDLDHINEKELRTLRNRARKLFQSLEYRGARLGCYGSAFDREECFISSSMLHGFYFPNLNARLSCIAFRNGQPVAIFNEEGE